MQIDYDGYYCEGTNIYTYKNEEHKKNILIEQYFKVLKVRYDKLYINCFMYEVDNITVEYTYVDFINDLIKYYFRIIDNDDGDISFLILDKMGSSKSFEEFISYINGIKDGLAYVQ